MSLQVDLETPKELHGLDNDYPLAPNNKEIRKETLSNYQLKIADFYNTAIDKSMCFMMKTCNFNAWVEAKKNMMCIRIQSITIAKRNKWWQKRKSAAEIDEQCCVW